MEMRQLTQGAEAAIDAAVHDTRSCECWEQRATALLYQRHGLNGMTCDEQRAVECRVRERIEDALEDALIDAHIAEQDRGGDICASCGADPAVSTGGRTMTQLKTRMRLLVGNDPAGWGSDATTQQAECWCREVCESARDAGMIEADTKNGEHLYVTPDMRAGFVGAFGDAWYEDRETNEHIDPNDVLDIDWFGVWCGFDGAAAQFAAWLRGRLA